MKDVFRTKAQLIKENNELRQQVSGLEAAEAELWLVKEDLKKEEEKYRTAFEHTGTAMMVVEEDTTITMANHKLEKVTGYPQEEVGKGRKWIEFVEKEDLDRLMEYHVKRRENPDEVPEEYELRLKHKNGEMRDFLMSISMIPDTKKSLISLIDITERKQMEKTLQESERKYRDLVENANDIIYTIDFEGNFTSANAAAVNTYGYSLEEIRNSNISKIVDPGYMLVAQKKIEDELQGKKKMEPYELLLTWTKSGKPIWIEVSKRLIVKDGRVEGIQGIARNITERKEAEEALRKSEERFRMIAETSIDYIFQTNKDGTTVYCSPAVERILGYSPKEREGSKFESVILPLDLPKAKAMFKRAMKGETIQNLQIDLLHKSGRKVPIEVSIVPIFENKKVTSLFGIARDITERKSAEEKLTESERRFRETSELLPGVICEMNFDMYLTYVNKKGLEIFGYSREELQKGIQVLSIIHPEDRERVIQGFTNVLSGDFGTPKEYKMIKRDGTEIYTLVNTSPMEKGNKVSGVRSCIIDITQRKKAQEHLKQSEERFRSIFSQAPVGIALFLSTGQIIERNKSFKEIVSLSDKEEKKKNGFQLLTHLNITHDELQNLKKGENIYRESEFKSGTDKKGKPRIRHLSWHITPLGSKYIDPSLFLTHVLDITDRKLAEEAELRKAREETEKVNRIVEDLKKEILQDAQFNNIVSRSPKMSEIFGILVDMAQTTASVLIGGESGTGKELIARSLHELGPRKSKPFVAINCGALPENLLEAELFGYKAGAFTDAKKDKIGKFAAAEGGTIFFDEIGDLSPAMQVKLLRVLQEKTYEPLGSVTPLKADVRVIAASNRDIGNMVKRGLFRKDLFYRINVLNIELPSLRERVCDIPLLCDHFISNFNARYLKDIKGVSDEALDIILAYNFPGNIRELENLIEHAFVLCKGDIIQTEHLSKKIRSEVVEEEIAKTITTLKTFKDVERFYIESMLEETNGDKLIAAKRMSIHKATLYRKMKELDIDRQRNIIGKGDN